MTSRESVNPGLAGGVFLIALALTACGGTSTATDAGVDADTRMDADVLDADVLDADVLDSDVLDAGADATLADAGTDSGVADAGPPDPEVGTPCTEASTCPGGVCVAIDAMRSVCSTPCAESTDCIAGWTCGPDGGADVCLCTPTDETCDGVDNDCDGILDEGTGASIGCGTGEVCAAGGGCECPTAHMCGAFCVDIDTHPDHCGGCGTACDFVCSGATCGGLTHIRGGQTHTCAIVHGGVARCWGQGTLGRIGDGTTTTRQVMTDVVDIGEVLQVAAGAGHSCAILADRTAVCWGNNSWGQLGNGTATATSAVPTPVRDLTNVAQIEAGSGSFSCALLMDGSAFCWGIEAQGQLGNGGTATRAVRTPVPVTGLTDATEIALGSFHACARHSDGRVSCWGQGNRLGSGTMTPYSEPHLVTGITDALSISAGSSHTCARRTGGVVSCWGANLEGQLGDGTTMDRLSPTDIPGAAGAIALDLGYGHSCARFMDGSVKCWGRNSNGQLGDGTMVEQLLPQTVPGLTGVIAVTTGDNFSCAIVSGGQGWCWGQNFRGQLGDSTMTDRLVPTPLIWP